MDDVVVKRILVGLSAVIAILAGLLVGASSASASSAPRGRLITATQSSGTHVVTITGWAYDPGRPAKAVGVAVFFDGRYVRTRATNLVAPTFNRNRHLSGKHAFRFNLPAEKDVRTVLVRQYSMQTHGQVSIQSMRVGQVPPPSVRIIAAARKYYKLRSPYVMGGTTPRGFDCSGYTRYVYREAEVPALPRTAEQQRRAARPISRSAARPGDLVFYLSGGSAYHVAIYAGHGMQYAAATERDGIRYQPVWSSAVRYGTTWH
jgi:cell wall-associated NlpC family hydrolase